MSDEELAEGICFVDSNIWLYMLIPGQDTDKAKAARELVCRSPA
jgi:predicted nucleic acid-binding protein